VSFFHAVGTVSFDSSPGNYILIQHNTKGAKNLDGTWAFDRYWADFEVGFGNASLDAPFYWRGLQMMHDWTKQGNWELLVRIRWADDDQTPSLRGKWAWHLYTGFRIGSPDEDYTFNIEEEKESENWVQGSTDYLIKKGGHAYSINGRKFTTKNRDNDLHSGNCAKYGHAGWWWNACAGVCLNNHKLWWEEGPRHYPAESIMAIRQV
jgi:ficolin